MNQNNSSEELKKAWIDDWAFHDDKPEHQADWWIEKLDQELQKARESWLREEIVKLEGMKVCTDAGRADSNYYHCENTRDVTLQTIIDRYHSELDQPINSIFKE